MWTLCGLCTSFLASRLAVRMRTKGKLRRSDYFLVVALPCLYAGCALLDSSLATLYVHVTDVPGEINISRDQPAGTSARLTSAIELLWITVYCVKASFLAQFKFHKPPYAYVSKHLTRFYWVTIGICGSSFLFTLAVPILLCRSSSELAFTLGPPFDTDSLGHCEYLRPSNTVTWEIALSIFDIVTDISGS